MIAYDATDYMYEKYNAFEVGVGGGGGEYVPQIGFGWSNAVALMLLDDLYPASSVTPNDDSSSDSIPGWMIAVIVILILGVLVSLGVVVKHNASFKQNGKSHTQEAHVHNAMSVEKK